jgi:thymidylate synthase ThyX
MMRVFEGKCGIKVTVLADSINAMGQRFITYEIEYPRLILAELNTHRALSKNSFSSRAVPYEKMLKQLTGRPVRFGANQAGMQDKGEDFNAPVFGLYEPDEAWDKAKDAMIYVAGAYKDAGYHKQVYNRLLEPFQMMKTVISGTEWANFFWLRDDDAADPTLRELARVMREAATASVPRLLRPGQWHLPYIATFDTDMDGNFVYWIADEQNNVKVISLEDAIKISCARCAAVSYRNEGYGLEKSVELYERLVGADKKHSSALEHCGTPMEAEYLPRNTMSTIALNVPHCPDTWQAGITNMDRKGRLWSGNLCGWIQHRKLIPGENYED